MYRPGGRSRRLVTVAATLTVIAAIAAIVSTVAGVIDVQRRIPFRAPLT